MSAAINMARNPPLITTISQSVKRRDGVYAVFTGRETAQSSYALPHPFPDGVAWAAIKHGGDMNTARVVDR